MTRESMQKTIEDARESVRKAKRAYPGLFPQYHAVQRAEREVKEAKERLRLAKEAWRKL